jgi:hypothetical protein
MASGPFYILLMEGLTGMLPSTGQHGIDDSGKVSLQVIGVK